MNNYFEQEHVGDTLVIRLKGRLDAKVVEAVKVDFRKVSEANVLVSFADVSFIDSSGLGLIVSTCRRIRENGGELSLCSLSPQVQAIFELTRLHRVFDIYESEELALAS